MFCQTWSLELKSTGLCFFLLLQVTVGVTAGEEGKRKRMHSRSTHFAGSACGGA